MASTTVIFILLPMIFDSGQYEVDLRSNALSALSPMILFVFSLAYLTRVHSMLHEKNTLPYVSIPASNIEKYIEILILGVVYYLMAIVAIQINYWIELWRYPMIKDMVYTDILHDTILIEGTTLINPLMIFDGNVFILVLFSAGLCLLMTTLFSKKRYAIPLYFIAPMAIMMLLVYILSQFYESYSINFASGEELDTIEIIVASIMIGIGIAGFVGSYFALSHKQVKS